jgi:hypothetical protein
MLPSLRWGRVRGRGASSRCGRRRFTEGEDHGDPNRRGGAAGGTAAAELENSQHSLLAGPGFPSQITNPSIPFPTRHTAPFSHLLLPQRRSKLSVTL